LKDNDVLEDTNISFSYINKKGIAIYPHDYYYLSPCQNTSGNPFNNSVPYQNLYVNQNFLSKIKWK